MYLYTYTCVWLSAGSGWASITAVMSPAALDMGEEYSPVKKITEDFLAIPGVHIPGLQRRKFLEM